jgi:hypothetical protein
VATPRYPALYQLNTRVWLTDLGRRLGRAATLDDIPDEALDRIAALGFDWVWLLSVWQTGLVARAISRSNPGWRQEFAATLPDLTDDDIPGSGFAITGYDVATALGGDGALARLRGRLRARGLRLMLDFVPNHTAPDHPWVRENPGFYVQGTPEQLAAEPHNYTRVTGRDGQPRVLAYGRDPYFAGWPDTLQLDYANPALQDAQVEVLRKIAGQCDGVRCDMAMLVLPEVFERTWGRRPGPFWARAIAAVRQAVPGFCFMAEVYWDLEWTMQELGFDYAYDKRLYDRLRAGDAGPVRDHLRAEPAYQDRLARFLENHDEPRAAATFPPAQHQAAAVVTYLTPGLRFLHQGQLEGRRKRISPHLGRAPDEPVDGLLQEFYGRLLAVLRDPVVRDGNFRLLDCSPAWDGNGSAAGFIAWLWSGAAGERLLMVVNYSPGQGQCYVRLPCGDLQGRPVVLADSLGTARYQRDGTDLVTRGLYLDIGPWAYHAFAVWPG